MSASSKILMVFPNSMWPVVGGGAARAWAMIDGLRASGFEIVLIAPDAGSHNKEIESRVNSYIPFEPRHRDFASRIKDKLTGASLSDKLRMPELEKCVEDASREYEPIACITHFVRTARVLDDLPDSCISIIDTIDIQYLRGEDAAQHGGKYDGPSWSREEEAAELNRAEVLIAIQDHEAAILQDMCSDKKVITVGHAVPVEESSIPQDPPQVLYVGNMYGPNIEGINLFIDDAWLTIREAVPNAELHICGRVCEGVSSTLEGVVCHGVVDDLRPFYHCSAVVINPVMYGTGLKIKTVEALGYGKAVVSTPAGVLGIGNSEEVPVLIGESPAEMSEPVVNVITHSDVRMKWEQKAYSFAEENLTPERVLDPLMKLLKARV